MKAEFQHNFHKRNVTTGTRPKSVALPDHAQKVSRCTPSTIYGRILIVISGPVVEKIDIENQKRKKTTHHNMGLVF